MATFDQFVGFLEKPESDIIVFDTAPTGKILRELAMPFDWAGFLQKQIQEGSKLAEFFPADTNSIQDIERIKSGMTGLGLHLLDHDVSDLKSLRKVGRLLFGNSVIKKNK